MNTKLTFKQSVSAGAIAGVASLVINAVLFFVFHAAGILTDDIMIQPNQPLTIVPVIFSSVMPSIVGSCVFFLFEKFAKNGYKGFTILSIILLVLSFMNPFMGIPNVTMGYAVVLNVMHIVVAFALLYFIKKAKK